MKSESIKELATALAKAQQEIKGAHKDATNPFFKSKYADLTSVWDACQSALNKNGLSIVQTMETMIQEIERQVIPILKTTLLHSSGEWIDGSCPLINQKEDMQGLGSAISYARRYGLAAICGVVAADDDAEGTKSEIKTEKTIPQTNTFLDKAKTKPCTANQAKLIHAKLLEAGLQGQDGANLLNKYGTHLPERIPFINVNDVLADIEKFKLKPKHKDYDEPPPFEPNINWNN